MEFSQGRDGQLQEHNGHNNGAVLYQNEESLNRRQSSKTRAKRGIDLIMREEDDEEGHYTE